MMNFGPMATGVGGNSSSAASNLSALAPPFTVDRLNPSFNTSPPSFNSYSDSRYAVEPFNKGWQYAHQTAPRPELVIDSAGQTTVPFSDGYPFTASASISPSNTYWSGCNPGTRTSGRAFAYGGGEIKPYMSGYVTPLIGENSPLVLNEVSHYSVVPTSGMNLTSQLDYTPSPFDLEYGPQWVGSLGFDDGKRAKRAELDGSFFSDKAYVGGSCSYNQLDQGVYSSANKSKGDSEFLYQKPSQVSNMEFYTGSSSGGHMEDKHLEQNLGLFTYDSCKTDVLKSNSTYSELHPSFMSCELHNNFSNYQSSCTPSDNCVKAVDTPFVGPLSALRSSPAVVIRPLPSINVGFGQGSLSHKQTHGNNSEGAHLVDFDQSYLSKQKDSGIEPSFRNKKDDIERNFISFPEQGDDLIPPSSVKDLSSSMPYMGTSSHKVKARHASQPLSADSSGGGSGIACDNALTINSTDISADYVDTHNQGVDSPCWKGAPHPKMLTLDVEAVNSKIVEKILGEYHGFDQEENQNMHQVLDSNKVLPEKACQGNKNYQNECARIGVVKLERPLNTICSSNVQSLLDDGKCTLWTSTTTHPKGIGIGTDTNMVKKGPGAACNLNGRFDVKACDTMHLLDEEGAGMPPNCVSEGGDVAVHAAEKVLESPVSQDDDAIKHPRLPDPKLNLPMMIKAMHNLSEVVLFHVSNHTDSLDGENSETLKHIISNLDSCLSKNIDLESNKPQLTNPVGESSGKNLECAYMGGISESLQSKYKVVNSDVKHGSGDILGEQGSHPFSVKSDERDEKLLKFPPLGNDLDITRDDEMAKAIKSVLEQNFYFDKEMQSQAVIFKNLWLEAEAKLCSISYKARFDRMKILMGGDKLKASQAASDLPLKSHHGSMFLKPTKQDDASSSMSGLADGVEASVMERFNILKSREENLKPTMVEGEQQSELVHGEHAPSAVGRFNMLKSEGCNSTLIGVEVEHEDKMIGVDHAPSVMDRFNILKAREADPKSVGVEKEKPGQMHDGEYTDEKYSMVGRSSQTESETLDVVLKPHFLYQSGFPSLGEGNFSLGSGSAAGYDSQNEFQVPATNCTMIHPFDSGSTINQDKSGSHGSLSSDWEHVLRDDISWKNS